MGGIAAVNPRQFRNGPAHAEPRSAGIEAVGHADEYVKRIFCFMSSQTDRMGALKAQIRELSQELFGKLPPKNVGEYLVELTGGSKAATAVRIRDLMDEVTDLADIIDTAHHLFGREARRRNPKMRGLTGAKLHSDWSFSEIKEPRGFDVGALLSSMFKDAFGDKDEPGLFGLDMSDLPDGLAARLRDRDMPGGFMPQELRDAIDGLDLAEALGGSRFGHRMGRGR
jgi:hypothetical protein